VRIPDPDHSQDPPIPIQNECQNVSDKL